MIINIQLDHTMIINTLDYIQWILFIPRATVAHNTISANQRSNSVRNTSCQQTFLLLCFKQIFSCLWFTFMNYNQVMATLLFSIGFVFVICHSTKLVMILFLMMMMMMFKYCDVYCQMIFYGDDCLLKMWEGAPNSAQSSFRIKSSNLKTKSSVGSNRNRN